MRKALIPLLFCLALGVGTFWYRSREAVRPSVTEQLNLAHLAIEQGEHDSALALLEAIDGSNSDRARAKQVEGLVYWNQNRWSAAKNCWLRALEIDPRVPEACWDLLNMYFILSQRSAAVELALQQYPLEPNRRDQTLLLLELARQEHEAVTPEKVKEVLEPVRRLEPDNVAVNRALGRAMVQLSQVEQGLELVQSALESNPKSLENWGALAFCLFEIGDLDRVERLWDEATEEARTNPLLQRTYAKVLDANEEYRAAAEELTSLIERQPSDQKAHYLLSRVYRKLDRVSEAQEHANTAEELDRIRAELGQCYQDAGNQSDNPSRELCLQFSSLYEALHEPRIAELWRLEASRRGN